MYLNRSPVLRFVDVNKHANVSGTMPFVGLTHAHHYPVRWVQSERVVLF